ncbi:4Fe-4S binding protein [Clostridium paridis]|uniref:4Fe-4S binding protein n=1 Tax=Clostridium paridis TaxID=2803863 RepID=A0A937FB74_9CLOT|nr:4Fe-4S binding protein [Clostridium paridis]MBL4930714.1 4Fe-4S binding protein [Clostridium paridis]
MKRQRIRSTLLIISFLLFPLVLYYFSPYLIVMGASEGVITGSFIVFGIMFLTSLFLGRGFCGWICPAGGLQECCSMAVDKKVKGGKLNWIKYLIWTPWIILIIMMFISAGGIKKIGFFYQTYYGISVINVQAYAIYYFVVGGIALLSLSVGKRAFCHYGCWMAPFMIIGSKIKNKFKYPSLHLKADEKKCIDCKLCNKKCPMSLEVSSMVQKGDMHNSECILCGQCVDTCPKNVIKYSFIKK